MKRRIGILLLAATCLAGLLLTPSGILAAQERRLYDRKMTREVLTPQFAADAGTLFQRLQTLVQHGQVTELSSHAGSDLYYDKEALLNLYRQELSSLAENNEGAETFLPMLETLMEQDLQESALEVGYSCVVDPSTGGTYLMSCVRSTQSMFTLEMDMISGKLTGFCASRELCEDPERVIDAPWSCAANLAQYLGLSCIKELNLEEYTQYLFQEPAGDGSTLTFQLRLDDILEFTAVPGAAPHETAAGF